MLKECPPLAGITAPISSANVRTVQLHHLGITGSSSHPGHTAPTGLRGRHQPQLCVCRRSGAAPRSGPGTHKCLLPVCTVATVATGQGPALLCHEVHVTLLVTSSEEQLSHAQLILNNDNRLQSAETRFKAGSVTMHKIKLNVELTCDIKQ